MTPLYTLVVTLIVATTPGSVTYTLQEERVSGLTYEQCLKARADRFAKGEAAKENIIVKCTLQ